MNKPLTADTVKLIVFFTSVSLLGLVVTQSFWIRKAFIISQGHFYHRADKALMDVVEELRDYADSSGRFAYMHEAPFKTAEPQTILDVIDTSLLTSLLNKYIEYHRLGRNFYFAIRKTSNDSVVYQSPRPSFALSNFNTYK